MKIELREITKDNFREAVKLKVKTLQNDFVATNSFSIAQSKFYSGWKPTAIYDRDKDEMVGFLMYGEDDESDRSMWLIRLMIDEKHQGKGFGREATIKFIEQIKNSNGHEHIFVSFNPSNTAAQKLYETIGFEDTGRIEEGEKVYCLKF